jgi:hypothetical protein
MYPVILTPLQLQRLPDNLVEAMLPGYIVDLLPQEYSLVAAFEQLDMHPLGQAQVRAFSEECDLVLLKIFCWTQTFQPLLSKLVTVVEPTTGQ